MYRDPYQKKTQRGGNQHKQNMATLSTMYIHIYRLSRVEYCSVSCIYIYIYIVPYHTLLHFIKGFSTKLPPTHLGTNSSLGCLTHVCFMCIYTYSPPSLCRLPISPLCRPPIQWRMGPQNWGPQNWGPQNWPQRSRNRTYIYIYICSHDRRFKVLPALRA